MRGLILIFVVFLLLPGSFKQSDLYMNSKISPLIDEYAPRVEEYFNDLISDKDIVEEATNLIEPLVDDTQNLIEEVSDTQEEENS